MSEAATATARLAVIVPAYNAARHLAGVLDRIVAARPPGLERIIVVDDGSGDDTAAIARARASSSPLLHALLHVIIRPRNGGYGGAMKDGLAAARAAGATRAASVHADGQYSPEALAGLLAALDDRRLDLLQGSRIAGGGARAGGMPRYKIVGNWILNKLERRVFALPLTDFHSGYLVYGRRALDEIPFARLSDSFDFDMEAIAAARARGLAVGEGPIATHYGDEVSHLNPVTYGLRVLRVMWRYQRGQYG
jgi:glycosyltransferase involved in cell wall biosynthesis